MNKEFSSETFECFVLPKRKDGIVWRQIVMYSPFRRCLGVKILTLYQYSNRQNKYYPKQTIRKKNAKE